MFLDAEFVVSAADALDESVPSTDHLCAAELFDTAHRHLSGHHRETVQKILWHPISRNIEWHDVVSLLEVIGTVEAHRDNKVEVGSQTGFFDVPAHQDIEVETVVDLRRMLTAAGCGVENQW